MALRAVRKGSFIDPVELDVEVGGVRHVTQRVREALRLFAREGFGVLG